MREIKFRAWNGKKMLYPGYDGDQFPSIPMCGQPLGLANGGMAANATYMQYTGLKDKNGKEIYEGDIVAIKHKDGISIRTVCKWIDRWAGFSLVSIVNDTHSTHYSLSYSGSSVEGTEIIGNIYENPELLED